MEIVKLRQSRDFIFGFIILYLSSFGIATTQCPLYQNSNSGTLPSYTYAYNNPVD